MILLFCFLTNLTSFAQLESHVQIIRPEDYQVISEGSAPSESGSVLENAPSDTARVVSDLEDKVDLSVLSRPVGDKEQFLTLVSTSDSRVVTNLGKEHDLEKGGMTIFKQFNTGPLQGFSTPLPVVQINEKRGWKSSLFKYLTGSLLGGAAISKAFSLGLLPGFISLPTVPLLVAVYWGADSFGRRLMHPGSPWTTKAFFLPATLSNRSIAKHTSKGISQIETDEAVFLLRPGIYKRVKKLLILNFGYHEFFTNDNRVSSLKKASPVK